MPTEDAYSSGHLVLSHFGACKCSNVETNISWTCLVSGLLSFEHPSVLLFLPFTEFVTSWKSPKIDQAKMNSSCYPLRPPFNSKIRILWKYNSLLSCDFCPFPYTKIFTLCSVKHSYESIDGNTQEQDKSSDIEQQNQQRTFVVFFNMPTQAPTRGQPFYTVFPEKPPHWVALYDTLGIRTHSRHEITILYFQVFDM